MTKSGQQKGCFVTFEGGEGSGKSSQIKHLENKLKKLGRKVVTTREPGGTTGAEIIRHVLLSGAAEKMGPEMEAMLFSAARADHVDQVIKPALEAGKIVLCDRFVDSTRVYQGIGGQVDMEYLRELERIACAGVWPDLTLVLDLPPEEGMKRAAARLTGADVPDRFEKETMALQTLRRNAYRDIVKQEPERCVLIPAAGSEEEVFSRVWRAVKRKLGIREKAKN